MQVDPEREPPILKSIPVPVPRVPTPGVTLPTSAHSMVVGQGGVWTVRFQYLYHVDPSRSEVRDRLQLEFGPSFSVNLAEGSDKIWVAYTGGLDELNPATGEQREAIRLAPEQSVSNDVAFGGGFVWLGGSDGRLVRYDPRTGERSDPDGPRPDRCDRVRPRVGLDGGHRWWNGDEVRRRDDAARRGDRDANGSGLHRLGDVAVWALSTSVGTLSRIDPATNDVRYQVPVGPDPPDSRSAPERCGSATRTGSSDVWTRTPGR